MSERRVTILNGSARLADRTDDLANALVTRFEDTGCRVIHWKLGEQSIAPCLGCFGCWIKTPGVCVIDDVARDIARDAVQSEVVVYVTPIVFGGYSAPLKSALDRMIPIILPHFTKLRGEVHHVKRYRAYPSVLAVGLLPHPDLEQEEIFRALVQRSSLNMRAPKHVVRVFDRPSVDLGPDLETAVAEVTK